jgi:hypothetical protein
MGKETSGEVSFRASENFVFRFFDQILVGDPDFPQFVKTNMGQSLHIDHRLSFSYPSPVNQSVRPN